MKGPGVDIPEAFNAFVRLALAPAGVDVPALQDVPEGFEWHELADAHGLRDQWVTYVNALARAQALAVASTAEARRRLRREFKEWDHIQVHRVAFLAAIADLLQGVEEPSAIDADLLHFAKSWALDRHVDELRDLIAGSPERTTDRGLAARLSVAFNLFGDGEGPGSEQQKRTRARDSFRKAQEAFRAREE